MVTTASVLVITNQMEINAVSHSIVFHKIYGVSTYYVMYFMLQIFKMMKKIQNSVLP